MPSRQSSNPLTTTTTTPSRDSGIVGKRNDVDNDQGKAQFVIVQEETKQLTGVNKNGLRKQGSSGAVVAKMTTKAHGGAKGGREEKSTSSSGPKETNSKSESATAAQRTPPVLRNVLTALTSRMRCTSKCPGRYLNYGKQFICGSHNVLN
jgi:hypothetical protein